MADGFTVAICRPLAKGVAKSSVTGVLMAEVNTFARYTLSSVDVFNNPLSQRPRPS
jgi:hypothetical protein